MSAYDNIRKKKYKTKLDLAVLYYGENPVDEAEVRDANEAAAELAQLTAALQAAREALTTYAARENWWITHHENGKVDDAIWQEGNTDTEPWKIADVALAEIEKVKS